MKFCIDCKHCEPGHEPENTAKCYYEARTNPVTGKRAGTYCSVARSYGQDCGPDGNSFEPKEPEAKQ